MLWFIYGIHSLLYTHCICCTNRSQGAFETAGLEELKVVNECEHPEWGWWYIRRVAFNKAKLLSCRAEWIQTHRMKPCRSHGSLRRSCAFVYAWGLRAFRRALAAARRIRHTRARAVLERTDASRSERGTEARGYDEPRRGGGLGWFIGTTQLHSARCGCGHRILVHHRRRSSDELQLALR